jgi:septal ring factor EnvC (AmiA/AmiB activator)
MLEQVRTAIDGRIVQLETDIAATERALTSARPELLAVAAQSEDAARFARESSQSGGEERMAILMALIAFPIVLAVARRMWRQTPPARPVSVESAGRLERIEQAVEAMAIEIERVSEGQRFVTKLLSEAKAAPALDGARLRPTTHTGRES